MNKKIQSFIVIKRDKYNGRIFFYMGSIAYLFVQNVLRPIKVASIARSSRPTPFLLSQRRTWLTSSSCMMKDFSKSSERNDYS